MQVFDIVGVKDDVLAEACEPEAVPYFAIHEEEFGSSIIITDGVVYCRMTTRQFHFIKVRLWFITIADHLLGETQAEIKWAIEKFCNERE